VIKLYPKRERDFTKSIAREKDIDIGNISDIALFLLFFIIINGVRQSPLGTTATTGLLCQTQMIYDGECGAIVRIKIGRGLLSTRRKPAQHHFVHHKSHMTRPRLEHGPPRCEASN
jgi:hypothetical protein